MERVIMESSKRWKAVIHYRTDNGLVDVEHFMEELGELEDLVEQGPYWDCIADIHVTLNRPTRPGVTVEEARTL